MLLLIAALAVAASLVLAALVSLVLERTRRADEIVTRDRATHVRVLHADDWGFREWIG